MDECEPDARVRQVVAAVGAARYRELSAQLRHQLAGLADQIANGAPAAEIGLEAHRLRGAAGALGAESIVAVLARLELTCSHGPIDADWRDTLIELAKEPHDEPTGTKR